MRSLIKQSIIILSVTAILLIGIECTLRLTGYKPAGAPPFSMDLAQPDSYIGFKAFENISWYFDTTPGGGDVVRIKGTTDKNGYRPTIENADCKTCPYIVVIGDSATFDAEAPDDKTWPELMAQNLSAAGYPYKIINISFRGWSAWQQARALKAADLRGKKIDYVLYLEIANDPIENIKTVYDLPAPLATEKNGTISIDIVTPNKDFFEKAKQAKREYFARKYALTTLAYSLTGKTLTGATEPPKPISTTDKDYKIFWPDQSLANARKYIGLLLGQGEDAALAHEAYGMAIKDMKETAEALGARMIVVPGRFGPYTKGSNAFEFAKLLRVPQSEVDLFLNEWDAYNLEIEKIAKESGADFLNIDMNIFEGVSYRDYAAVPHDWHLSVKANEILAAEISKKFLEKVN